MNSSLPHVTISRPTSFVDPQAITKLLTIDLATRFCGFDFEAAKAILANGASQTDDSDAPVYVCPTRSCRSESAEAPTILNFSYVCFDGLFEVAVGVEPSSFDYTDSEQADFSAKCRRLVAFMQQAGPMSHEGYCYIQGFAFSNQPEDQPAWKALAAVWLT